MKRLFILLALLGLAATGYAQTVTEPMVMPRKQFLDASGIPLAGGHVCTYKVGTTTPQATYTDRTGTVPNATCDPIPVDPIGGIILDAGGYASIWIKCTESPIKVVVYDALGVLQWSEDGVQYPGDCTATTGQGTVTSVAMLGDNTVYNAVVPGSPITTAGTLAPTLRQQDPSTFLGGPEPSPSTPAIVYQSASATTSNVLGVSTLSVILHNNTLAGNGFIVALDCRTGANFWVGAALADTQLNTYTFVAGTEANSTQAQAFTLNIPGGSNTITATFTGNTCQNMAMSVLEVGNLNPTGTLDVTNTQVDFPAGTYGAVVTTASDNEFLVANVSSTGLIPPVIDSPYFATDQAMTDGVSLAAAVGHAGAGAAGIYSVYSTFANTRTTTLLAAYKTTGTVAPAALPTFKKIVAASLPRGAFTPILSPAGAMLSSPHTVIGRCTLGTDCAVTLAPPSAFSSDSSYVCLPHDITTGDKVTITYISGTQFTWAGTGVDVIGYACFGD